MYAIVHQERLGEIDGHPGIVGPTKTPIGCSSNKPPNDSLKRSTFVRRAQGIARCKAQDTTGELVSGEVHFSGNPASLGQFAVYSIDSEKLNNTSGHRERIVLVHLAANKINGVGAQVTAVPFSRGDRSRNSVR